MLYPSQQQTQEELRQSFDAHPLTLLEGMSGSGKSLIAEQVLAEAGQGEIVEGGGVIERLEEIIDAQKRGIRMIILAQPHTDITHLMTDKNIPVNIVSMKCLTPEEVQQWISGIVPALSDEERSLVLKYSLGIPLLLEQLCKHRPITSASGFSQCAVYVQNIVEQCFLDGEHRDHEIREIMTKHTYFSVPQSILSRLADCKNTRANNTPISLLQSKLNPDVEFPSPASVQLFDRYQEWLEAKREEPFFEVFIESMPDAEQFLEQLGYCEYPDPCIEQELSRFVYADTRKGAAFYPNDGDGLMRQKMNHNSDSLDPWLREHILEFARASGIQAGLERREVWGREEVIVRFSSLSTPLYLHKHDHTHGVVMPVAYTVECALQKNGVPYAVRYNDVMFRYDPRTQTYTPLSFEKVDYWRELLGDTLDDEEPLESEGLMA